MAPRREPFTSSSSSSSSSSPSTATVLEPSWRGSRYNYNYNHFHADVPAMMEPQNDEGHVRPSLLAFRPSRMLRMSQQQHQNTVYKQHLRRAVDCSNTSRRRRSRSSSNNAMDRSTVGTVRTSDTSEDDWYESSDAGSSETSSTYVPSPGPQVNTTRDNRSISTVEEDEEKENYYLHTTCQRLDRTDSFLPMMAMSFSGPIPLLERKESDEEHNEIDTIICDPSKLPRTLIVDEDGFTLSRESVMARAANVPRGGVIKSGLLFKQGFGLRAGGWKVRFVVLTSTKMTFFREERGRKRGEIDLAKCSAKSIEIMPRDSIFDGSQATMWRFAIRGKSRRILLSAYTESDMKDWLRCLHVALAVQGSGFGRYTDFVVPNGTFLASRSGGLMRSSGNL